MYGKEEEKKGRLEIEFAKRESRRSKKQKKLYVVPQNGGLKKSRHVLVWYYYA